MMGFYDLDIHGITEDRRGDFRQLEGRVDTHSEIGCPHDRDFLAGLPDGIGLGIVKAGRPDHHALAMARTGFNIGRRGIGDGEIDQHIECVTGRRQFVDNRDTAGTDARQFTRVGTNCRRTGAFDGGSESQAGIVVYRRNQRLAHSTRRTSDPNPCHAEFL